MVRLCSANTPLLMHAIENDTAEVQITAAKALMDMLMLFPATSFNEEGFSFHSMVTALAEILRSGLEAAVFGFNGATESTDCCALCPFVQAVVACGLAKLLLTDRITDAQLAEAAMAAVLQSFVAPDSSFQLLEDSRAEGADMEASETMCAQADARMRQFLSHFFQAYCSVNSSKRDAVLAAAAATAINTVIALDMRAARKQSKSASVAAVKVDDSRIGSFEELLRAIAYVSEAQSMTHTCVGMRLASLLKALPKCAFTKAIVKCLPLFTVADERLNEFQAVVFAVCEDADVTTRKALHKCLAKYDCGENEAELDVEIADRLAAEEASILQEIGFAKATRRSTRASRSKQIQSSELSDTESVITVEQHL